MPGQPEAHWHASNAGVPAARRHAIAEVAEMVLFRQVRCWYPSPARGLSKGKKSKIMMEKGRGGRGSGRSPSPGPVFGGKGRALMGSKDPYLRPGKIFKVDTWIRSARPNLTPKSRCELGHCRASGGLRPVVLAGVPSGPKASIGQILSICS
jgi:hypothetical protein